MKLPVISGKDLIKALSKIGYEVDHITGSHAILRKVSFPYTRVTVPLHDEISKGTLRAIMRYLGLTIGALLDLLEKKR